MTTPIRNALVLIFAVAGQAAAQGGFQFATPDGIAALKLDTLSGAILTHRSPGVPRAEAADLQNLLTACVEAYHDSMSALRPVELALLDSAAWIQVSTLPYGLPHVNSALTPIVIVLPAHAPGLFRGLTGADQPDRLFRLLGLHELGHVLMDAVTGVDRRIERGDDRFPAWYSEFAATYFALSCLSDRPGDAAILRGSEDSLRALPRSAFTELDKLETLMAMETPGGTPHLFTSAGAAHFAWYQRLLNETAGRVHERLGRGFVTLLRSQAARSRSVPTSALVYDLSRSTPGLAPWLRHWGAIP